jgi:phosphatidylglycerophosphatase A
VIWAPLVLLDVAWWIRGLTTLGIFALGVWAAERVVRAEGKEDPQKVVVDEVAGMGLTLLLCAPMASNVVAGFVLFRLFDIWKPWPVSLADNKVKGGFGTMLDDMLAGAYALAALTLVERYVVPIFPGVLP